jgi:hypothetical protein
VTPEEQQQQDEKDLFASFRGLRKMQAVDFRTGQSFGEEHSY